VLLAWVVGAVVAAVAAPRLSGSWSFVVGTIAVAVASVWIAEPVGRWHGLPGSGTVKALEHSLQTLGAVHFPVAGRPGVVLICALLAGVGAVITRLAPGGFCFVPSVVLVAGSTVAQPSRGAAVLAVVLAAAAAGVVVARSADRVGALIGTVTTVAAALCVAAVSVGGGTTGAATGGGARVAGVPPSALSLVSHLTALQISDPRLVLFTASTPLPTYWQVGSLSVLSGDNWVPDAATAAALAGRLRPAAVGGAPAGATFTVRVSVENLSSRLLPVPPSTTGVSTGSLTSVGVLADAPSRPGLHYRAEASVPQTAQSGDGAAAGPSNPAVADTALPALPGAVSALARSVTASAATPLGKAEALVNWFRSPLFHYSLQPTGADLITFLTSSRTGSCEQFAGAYTVLARAVGLPTRVAIGFTTGVHGAGGKTVVRGIDAHAWPEVFLGGTWISFEPTPALPSGELSPPGVIGLTGSGTPNPAGPSSIPTRVGGSVPPSTVPLTTIPVTAPVVGVTPAVVHHRASGWGWVAPAVAGAVVVTGAALLVGWRRRRRRAPGDQLLRAWERIDRTLRRGDQGRPPWRTPLAHSRVLRRQWPDAEADTTFRDLEWLAALLEDSAYGGAAAGADEVRRADEVGRRLAKTLR
jgi:hypothetical protein